MNYINIRHNIYWFMKAADHYTVSTWTDPGTDLQMHPTSEAQVGFFIKTFLKKLQSFGLVAYVVTGKEKEMEWDAQNTQNVHKQSKKDRRPEQQIQQLRVQQVEAEMVLIYLKFIRILW